MRLADQSPSAWNPFVVFRWLVVCTQAITIWVTWPLWEVRTSPPMLPLIDLPQFGFGLVLLATLAVILLHAKTGIVLHSIVLLAAMLTDQMRLQPEFISQAILLWGTLPWTAARAICRAHLLALWFFSGLHKLLCPFFYSGDARWLVTAIVPDASETLSTVIGVVIASTEIGLAVTALFPKSRRFAVPLAFLLHSGIVVLLSFLLVWDPAVWPWNLALSVSGYVMIGSWKQTVGSEFRQTGSAARIAMACILVAPFGYYVGLVDTYLCHVLYSNHAPVAWIRTVDGQRHAVDTRPQLNVPVPQIERLYTQHFTAVAGPGDRLEIFDPRLWYRWHQCEHRVIAYKTLVRPLGN